MLTRRAFLALAPTVPLFLARTARFDPDERKGYGWLGRALDPQAETSYTVGGAVPRALYGRRSAAMALSRADELLLNDPASLASSDPATTDELLAFVRRQSVAA